METITRALTPPNRDRASPQSSAAVDAAARAERERADLEARRKREEDSLRRGVRGVRSLLSGGYRGFPDEGTSTLGG